MSLSTSFALKVAAKSAVRCRMTFDSATPNCGSVDPPQPARNASPVHLQR